MNINNPFITDKANIKWLNENWETFIDYMSKNHSLADCWHTVLDLSTFNDAYISGMIKKIEGATKKKIREEEKRKRELEGKSVTDDPKATKIEKKQAMIEEAIKARKKDEDDTDDWPD